MGCKVVVGYLPLVKANVRDNSQTMFPKFCHVLSVTVQMATSKINSIFVSFKSLTFGSSYFATT